MVRRMSRYLVCVSIALLGLSSLPTSRGRAEPLPLDQTLQLGRPAHPVSVSLKAGKQLTLVAAGKRRVLPIVDASDVRIERVPVGADGAVAILRVSAGDAHWVGLLGGRAGSDVLLFERADLTGDPGERRARDVIVTGEPKVVQSGLRFDGVSLCGQRPALLDAKRVDEETLLLVSQDAATLPTLASVEQATVASAPATSGAPLLRALSPVSSSELDDSTRLPRVPRALLDDDAAHGLSLRAGGFATFRWEGGALPIERFELVLHSKTSAPIDILWLGDRAEALRATLTPAIGESRFLITPARPIDGRCLALLLPKADGVELRELYAYTDLDREGGLDRLVGMLVQDNQQGPGAVDLLEKLGPVAAERVALRWDELSPRGRRRSLKVLGRALGRAPVRQRVLQAARADDADLRTAALATLERGGEPGRVVLRELSQSPTAAGDLAARALAAHPEELVTLLAALSVEGGAARASLRTAVATAARKDQARAREATTTWLASAPSVAARASLALALASAGDRDLAASVAQAVLPTAESFDDRYRLALALAGSTASEASEAWLRAQAEVAGEWMQRQVSLEALVQRGSSLVAAVADKQRADVYPRVRAGTLAPLVKAGQLSQVEQLLASDPWPLVRVEAARVLAPVASTRTESRAALEAALSDRASHVRRAAVEALTAAQQRASWPKVQRQLDQEDEALEVRMGALVYVRALCVVDATPALVKVARKLLSPATDDDSQLAVEALRVLHELGATSQKEGQSVVDKEGGPELKKLWERLPPARCGTASQS